MTFRGTWFNSPDFTSHNALFVVAHRLEHVERHNSLALNIHQKRDLDSFLVLIVLDIHVVMPSHCKACAI